MPSVSNSCVFFIDRFCDTFPTVSEKISDCMSTVLAPVCNKVQRMDGWLYVTLNQILNDALPSSSTSESETQEAINKKRISNTILLQAIEHTQTSC